MIEQSSRNILQTLESLHNGNSTIAAPLLSGLSDLDRTEMLHFQAAWGDLAPERRQALIKRLHGYARAHVEANYNIIFRWSLHDVDPDVRKWAISGLWEDNDVVLITPLARALSPDPAEAVRAAAATALGRFILWGELGELDPATTQPAREALMASLARADERSEVRRYALESLAFTSDTNVRPLILNAYDDEDDDMRAAAVRAMGNSGDTYWREQVYRELSSDLALIRLEAAYAAGELEIGEAVPQLTRLLDDKDIRVREAAVASLGHIGGGQARAALQDRLIAGDGHLRDLVRDALEEIAFNAGSDLVFMAEDEPDLPLDDFDDESDDESDDDEFDEVEDFDEDDNDRDDDDLSDADFDDLEDDPDLFDDEDDDDDWDR